MCLSSREKLLAQFSSFPHHLLAPAKPYDIKHVQMNKFHIKKKIISYNSTFNFVRREPASSLFSSIFVSEINIAFLICTVLFYQRLLSHLSLNCRKSIMIQLSPFFFLFQNEILNNSHIDQVLSNQKYLFTNGGVGIKLKSEGCIGG